MSALLPTHMIPKPWGRDVLPPPFVAPPGERIGEVWFEPHAALAQLLVKYIFTSENLSVQVHPSDAQRPGEGKEECWLVIAAEPGARLGIGFREPLDAERLGKGARDGGIMDLMAWHPVRAGDFFSIPAGTVHAIGAGVSLVEVQQNSDTTYRLYDYGRPRDLHIEDALAVANPGVYPEHLHRRLPESGAVRLVDGPAFRLDWLGSGTDTGASSGPALVIPLSGEFRVGDCVARAGSCLFVEDCAGLSVASGASWLLAQTCSS